MSNNSMKLFVKEKHTLVGHISSLIQFAALETNPPAYEEEKANFTGILPDSFDDAFNIKNRVCQVVSFEPSQF